MKIVLYSQDVYFMDIFSMYVKQQHPELIISLFTEKEKARSYIRSHEDEVDVVMADKLFFKDFEAQVPVEIIIGNQTIADTERKIQSLNIYQQRSDIVGDLKKIVLCMSGNSLGHEGFQGGRVAAFSSTQGGSGKTTIAYMTAIQSAKSRRTAYINLETAPYTQGLYQAEFDIAMEDLLFAVKDRRSLAGILISGLKKDQNQVLVLPPIKSMRDFMDITDKDIEYLIQALMDHGEVEMLIIDVPFDFSEKSQKVMEMSDRIFMVYTADSMGGGKQSVFAADPGKEGQAGLERVRYVQNRCPDRRDNNPYAMTFPFSQSIAKGVSLSMVLEGNGDFAKGCSALIQMV